MARRVSSAAILDHKISEKGLTRPRHTALISNDEHNFSGKGIIRRILVWNDILVTAVEGAVSTCAGHIFLFWYGVIYPRVSEIRVVLESLNDLKYSVSNEK